MARKLPFLRLFQYATKWDYVFILLGTAAAIMIGVLQPVLFLILGNIYSKMGPNATAHDYFDQTVEMVYLIIILGGCYLVVCYAAVVSWVYIGSRQSHHFRVQNFEALLAQDPQWFDQQNLAQLSSALNTNAVKLERATGDKLVMVIMTLTLIVSGIVINIVICLQLWLLSLIFLPLTGGGLVLTNIGSERTVKMDDKSYQAASTFTEELLPDIKTVLSLTAESSLCQRYATSLATSFKASFRSGGLTGFGTGLAVAAFLAFIATAFVVAAQIIDDGGQNWSRGDDVDVASVIIVVMVDIMAFNSIGTFVPCMKMIIQGQVAAGEMMEIINSRPKIVSGPWNGKVRGEIEFRKVTFAYPSKSDRKVLKGVDFTVDQKQRVAIVGESGSGKSTIVSLLLRLYDLTDGEILIDGRSIREWNLETLRNSIGIVSQEPLLFHGSLLENIRLGRSDITEEQIHIAAEKAQIGDFVRRLERGFATEVGEKGSQLSGGEKQRVALARVIVRSPKVLLLDEATSALDTNTERALMTTIEEALGQITTVMVAHRISTVRNASKIIVLDDGRVSESGSYEELMARQGRFYHYASLQTRESAEPSPTEPEMIAIVAADQQRAAQPLATEALLVPGSPQPSYMKRFAQMTSKECSWLCLGTFGTLLVALSYPISGLFLGYEVFTLSTKEGSELISDTKFYAWFYGLCILIVMVGFMLESLSFPLAAAKVTRRFRSLAFSKMLTYDPAYFDKHSASALGQRLSTDCEKISNLNGSVYSALMGLLLGLICSLVISGIFAWEIMLVGLAMLPAFFFSMLATFLAQFEGLVSYEYEKAAMMLSDAIVSHRTVHAFRLQPYFTAQYLALIRATQSTMRSKIHKTAIFFGMGFSLYLFCNALLFWFGAKMFVDERVSYKEMNVSMFAFLSGTDMISIVALFAPDVKQGQEAAKSIFQLLDYEPAISANEDGKSAPESGSVEFRHVSFSYPSRPGRILHDISFSLPARSKLALVGHTGSGKSTIWQLLMRYYDPTEGAVLIDGIDIRDYRLTDLRRSVGLVGQEPVLFSGSVRYNLMLGLQNQPADREMNSLLEDVQAASFVSGTSTLDLEVGFRGSKLSGGQKQRIALARALLRSPKILIFDEATSALDSETEAAVLAGIAEKTAACTCLVIAHRMKTIMGVGYVAVIHTGRLVEIGDFDELIEKKGYFFDLVQSQ